MNVFISLPENWVEFATRQFFVVPLYAIEILFRAWLLTLFTYGLLAMLGWKNYTLSFSCAIVLIALISTCAYDPILGLSSKYLITRYCPS
jgi:hypothetical protein